MRINRLGKIFLLTLFILAFHHRLAVSATTFNVVLARPTAVDSDFHYLYSSQNLFRLEWQAGTQGDYAFRSLDGSTRRIIDRLLIQHFFGGVGITDWFSIGLDFPIAWINHFQDPVPTTAPGFTNGIDLSDPRVEMKLNLLSRYRFPVGLAFVPFVHLPLGNASRFVGDETVVGGGLLALDLEVARRLLFTLNAGAEVKESVNLSNVNISSTLLTAGLGVQLNIIRSLDLTAEGYTRTPFGNLFKEEAETPVEMIGTFRYRLKNGLTVSAGGGSGIVHGVGAPRYRALLAVAYHPETEGHRQQREELEALKYKPKPPPAVEWSVIELEPKCPEDPSQFDPKVHDAGCPKYYELTEIATLSLRCPSRPEDFDPAVHDQGCPKVYEFRKESTPQEYATVYVLAAKELTGKCPEDPAQFDPEKHDPSCPKFFELKEAVSLIARCPEREEDFDPEIHDPSCPKTYTLKQQYASSDIQAIRVLSRSDVDQDGILDFEDRCPQVPGIAAGFGCPEAVMLFKKGQMLGTEVPITFVFNQWKVTPAIGKALNKVAETLINHPEIQRVRIEGHADSRGTAAANKTVSRNRAEAVKKFLVSCGVEEGRIRAVGLGASQPVAPNRTEAERAKNRRATVILLELVQ